ncbi:hypothetical protein GCM10027614_07150 [Micromonospora vulcania]
MIASISGSPCRAARITELGLPPTPIQVGMPPARIRGAVAAGPGAAYGSGPGDRFVLLELEEEFELLLEQPLVVGQVVAEQRKRLGRRRAPENHLRAAVRHGVERGELVVEPYRIVRAEHRHRGAEADPLGRRRDRREQHGCGRVVVPLAVVLTQAEHVQPDRLREPSLVHE